MGTLQLISSRLLQKNVIRIFKNFKRVIKMDPIEPNNDLIKEGKAEVLITGGNVFYNPVQEFNRDLR